jgi:hemerythrin-like domain-containing protein
LPTDAITPRKRHISSHSWRRGAYQFVGCPIGILTAEHQRERTLVAALASATETYAKDMASAKKRIIETLRALTELYPGHIWKEDYLLFPMTNKVLSADDQKDLGS